MTLEDLAAIAKRACALLDAGQVEVREDRALFVAVRDGRRGRAEAASLDHAALARAAKAARVHAGRMRAWPVPPLPEPENVRPAPVTDGRTHAVAPDGTPRVRSVVASTTGVLAAPDVRVAECVTLVDDATCWRRFDADGIPRQRVTPIDHGVLEDRVRDTASAPSTRHATLALTLAPQPDHLQLAPGDADDLPADVPAIRRPTPAEALKILSASRRKSCRVNGGCTVVAGKDAGRGQWRSHCPDRGRRQRRRGAAGTRRDLRRGALSRVTALTQARWRAGTTAVPKVRLG